jgi:hypothetical protein
MEARRGVAHEALVPARIVLDEKAFDQLAEALDRPATPTTLCAS